MTTKNGQFRDTGNIGNTRHRTKTKTIKQTRIKQTKINKPKNKKQKQSKAHHNKQRKLKRSAARSQTSGVIQMLAKGISFVKVSLNNILRALTCPKINFLSRPFHFF
jgi:hypothetical protein